MSRIVWVFVLGLAILVSGCMPQSRSQRKHEQVRKETTDLAFTAQFQSKTYTLKDLPKGKKSCQILRNQDLNYDTFLAELEADGLKVQIEVFSFTGPRRLQVVSSASPLDWTFRVNAKAKGKDYVMSWGRSNPTTCEGEIKKVSLDSYELSLNCRNLESQKDLSSDEIEFLYADLLDLKLVCKPE